MSALSTPGGGGTSTQNKPTSGKQKYQKLDINSLYCANRNESSEPSSVKSQLSRKHGMQSLGKVPSARRPPANLPSLKTETGQDPNTSSITAVVTTVTTPPTCSSQTVPATTSSSNVGAGNCGGGWVALPPPSSPHFRTEFPSLEAAAQPAHRSSEHSVPQAQLRPQTEGSWTCGGGASVRETTSPAAPAPAPATQQTPALRAILPPFLMKTAGSGGGGLGMGSTGAAVNRERSGAAGPPGAPAPPPPRAPHRPAPTPRAVEVLTARPILRDDQISSLDDMSRDAGWAQNDDIDYDQKLDFSDGESSAPNRGGNKNNNRLSVETERSESKAQEPGDEEQLWAERRQKQNNEVAQVVARARQRKEEEQRRQLREAAAPQKECRERQDRVERMTERDRNDNREREAEVKDKEKIDSRERERTDGRERERIENRDKERSDREREPKDKERVENRDRDRNDNRFENRDRERDVRDSDRERPDNKVRSDNRDRPESDKERTDGRDRDRNDNRERIDRDRFDRDRNRQDRDRNDRGDRERNDRERNERDRERDRDFRERDRDYARDREQNTPGFSKTFQENIPPRFLKLQQNRQQEDHKSWTFSAKSAPRRQEPPSYNAPRHTAHNGRRSYSRDYSDREDDFRREKEGLNPQWRSEMQDYDRSGRDLDRSNSRDSYKENEYKDKRNDSERKPTESTTENSGRSAADKLTEVFERKSIGLTETPASDNTNQAQHPERKSTPPSNTVQRESSEIEFPKTSWADVAQEEPSNYVVLKSSVEKVAMKEVANKKDSQDAESEENKRNTKQPIIIMQNTVQQVVTANVTSAPLIQNTNLKYITQTSNNQNFGSNQQSSQNSFSIQSQSIPSVSLSQNTFNDNISSKSIAPLIKSIQSESLQPSLQTQKHSSSDQPQQNLVKPIFTSQKSEKELSESESIISKASADQITPGLKNETYSLESLNSNNELQKRTADEKKSERINSEQINKIPSKEPIERKSSGSGSEKKSRGGYGGSYAVFNRGWGPRESRGRRSHRSSRSNNRASESDGSTDGAPGNERKDRRRTPRSPRGPKKVERTDEAPHSTVIDPIPTTAEAVENREPFAPRGQPSRRGRGGFQGTQRPPAPAKRVAGYGPPNTKSPFGQVNRAVKENEEVKENIQVDDKLKGNNKPRAGSSGGRGRDRRPKGAAIAPLSGEDENWETTSEHSENGGRRCTAIGKHPGLPNRGQSGRSQNSGQRLHNSRNSAVKVSQGDCKNTDVTETMSDLKVSAPKKDDEIVDDGFQEVRNKKNSKDVSKPTKEEIQNTGKNPRSASNHRSGRNGSSSRNSNDKSYPRSSAPVAPKSSPQYDRPRQANLAPRFVKQRQKQQLGLVPNFGPDTGGAPPPPPVNAWDKPISQSLRGNIEEPVEAVDIKSNQSSQRSTPGEAPTETKSTPTTSALVTDKAGVLDGTTPPVETIIFENTNYKTALPDEAMQQKYQISTNVPKPQTEEISTELEPHPLTFNGDVRQRPRSIQELIADNGRTGNDGDTTLGIQLSFDTSQKPEDEIGPDMKLDFAFGSDLGQLTEDKSAKTLGLPRGVHMSTSNTISPLAADLNLKIASVKKVWEMPAVAEGSEELQFAGFEESSTETGAPPNVCKVKPTQQLQSPPPQHYNHVGYQGGYGGLSVSSPPAAVLFNSSQQLLGSSQQLPQQGGLYGAFLDQSRGQFGGFPGTHYGAGSATPYNYQPPPDMFQSLPNQYRMAAAAGGGAAFGQSGQMANSPSTVLISSTSNSLMSATVKPSTQQIGAIGSKGGGVGGVGGVNTYQQQYLGYSAPVGEAPYSLPGLLPRPAPPASSYYSPYQPPTAPAPTYPLQFTQPAQSGAFGSQFLSSPLQVAAAAAVQQMQQYRGPMQQQYAAPQPRPPPQQQLKSPLHEHANGFSPLCEAASPTPKGVAKPQKPPHSPPQHKYHAPPPHPPPAHTPHQHHQQQQLVSGGNNGRCSGAAAGGGGAMGRGGMVAPRYPTPIQRPHAPAMPLYRAPPAPQPQPVPRVAAHHAQPRPNLYYHHHQRNGGGGGGDRAVEGCDATGAGEEGGEVEAGAVEPVAGATGTAAADVKAE